MPRSPLAWAVVALCLSAPARAQVTPQLVNGLGELGEPTTVGLIQGTVPENGYLVCSGVLIGCDSVITTAHCFNANASQKTHVYVPHAGFVPIASATRHPAYVDAITNHPPGWIETTREDDISFVKLAQPVTGITPAAIAWQGAPPPGTPGFVVGFGRDPVTEESYENPGIKRSGWMETAACEAASLIGLDVLCWSPTNPLPEPGDEVSTCAGDSGGPLFTGTGAQRVVSGITKGAIYDPQGQPDPCLPPVEPYDVSVHRHRAWIGGSDGAGGMVAATSAIPLSIRQCGNLAQLPDPTPAPIGCDGSPWGAGEHARACGFEDVLGGVDPIEARYSFAVPAGTNALRVALNGIASASGSVDTDLYLRKNQPAQTNQYDCASEGTGTLGFCEVADPVASTWHVLVRQPVSQGDHQVVVTLLGPSPAAQAASLGGSGAAFSALLAAVTAWWVPRARRRVVSRS
jgi:hypothetical protein